MNMMKCPKCTRPQDAELYNSPDGFACPHCGTEMEVYAFPALYRKEAKTAAPSQANLDDATCFYHDDKKAEQVCDCCGRFLCALCELPLGKETLCASCLESQRKRPGKHARKARQFRPDKLALGLATLPVIIYFPLTFLCAPAALFVALRYWKRAPDFAPGWNVCIRMAFFIALLEIIGWALLIFFIVWRIANG